MTQKAWYVIKHNNQPTNQLVILYTLSMWIFLYKLEKEYNNSHLLSTPIDLYEIPHVFYIQIIHTHSHANYIYTDIYIH